MPITDYLNPMRRTSPVDALKMLGVDETPDIVEPTETYQPVGAAAPVRGLRSAIGSFDSTAPSGEPSIQAPRPSPADALNVLQSSRGGFDPIALRSLQEDRASEMRRNLELAQRFPGRIMTGATPGDLANLEGDIASSPFTGAEPHAQTADYLARLRAANLSGYATPQEQAAAAARVEQQKIGAPAEVERIRAAGDIEKQRMIGEQQKALLESKGQQYQDFMDMLAKARLGGADVSHVTLPGGMGSIGYVPEKGPSPQTEARLAAALQKVQQGGGPYTSWGKLWGALGGTPTETPEFGSYKMLLGQTLAGVNAPDEYKQLVQGWLSDPAKMSRPLEDLIDVQRSNPEQVAILRNILQYVRGQ